tara:strand:+ start:301 stop:510 length:210 start_codon:yes stop_codon:yes gene_type:complete
MAKPIKSFKSILPYEIQLGWVICPTRATAKDLRSARNVILVITKLGQLASNATSIVILLISRRATTTLP